MHIYIYIRFKEAVNLHKKASAAEPLMSYAALTPQAGCFLWKSIDTFAYITLYGAISVPIILFAFHAGRNLSC